MKALRWIIGLGKEVVKNDLPNHAAEMAYFAMMAVFPFFLLLTTAVAFLPVPDLFAETMERLGEIAPQDVVNTIRDTIREVTTVKKESLLGATIFVCLWMSSGAMSSTTRGLNKAFGLKNPRRYARFFGLSLAMTCLLGLLLILSILILLLGPRIQDFVLSRVSLGWFGKVLFALLRNMLPIFFLFVAHAGIYWLCPAVKKRFRIFAPGTIFSVLGWIAVSYGFKLYLDQVNNYDKLYGSLGAVILTLFWFYLMSLVLLIGAQIDAVLHPEYKVPVTADGVPVREPVPWKLITVFLVALVGIPFLIKSCITRETFTPEAHDVGGEIGVMITQSIESGTEDFDHSAFSAILVKYVNDEGLVDYVGLESEGQALEDYIAELGSLDIGKLNPQELHATLLNLRNAATLRLVLKNHRRIQFIEDIPDFADRPITRIGKITVSLNEIRDGMLRFYFPGGRNLFAMNDGTKGSPPLMRFAFEGENLDEQLTAVAKLNLRPPRTFVNNGELVLPAIVSEFSKDFRALTLDGKVSSALVPYIYDAGMAIIQTKGEAALTFRNEDSSINKQN